jgi:phage terminase large subunit
VSDVSDLIGYLTPEERAELDVLIGTMPTPAEFPPWASALDAPRRYKILHGGRGSAKSWTVARKLLQRAAEAPLRVLCAREVQESIKDSVHALLVDQARAMGLPFRPFDREIRHDNGSRFVFTGLAQHTVDSIKSFEGADVCWIEEAQSVSKRSWDVLTPTIRKDDSEIWATLNPFLESDETYQRFVADPPTNTLSLQVNWSDNPWFPSVLNEERLNCLRRDPDNYANIWEGQPLRVASGAIYAAEVDSLYAEGRVRSVPYDPLLVVDTVWDLGWNDSMTIGMFQRAGSELRCIGYLESSRKTLDWYVRELEKLPYRWGTDFIPHDGRTRDYKTGKSTEQLLVGMGRSVEVLTAMSVEEGIRAARTLFPRVYIDASNYTGKPLTGQTEYRGPARLLECLKRYRRVVNRRTNEAGTPLHDEFSHGCFTPDTKVLTRDGAYRIIDLPQNGEVITQCGSKPYIGPILTRRNAQLVEVAFSDGTTVRCTPDHLFLTDSGWRSASTLPPGSQIQSCSTPSHSISMAGSTAFGRLRTTIRGALVDCTEKFGSVLSAISRAIATSTTGTTTPRTTPSATLSACRHRSTCLSRGGGALRSIRSTSVSLRALPLRIGTGLKKVAHGIAGWLATLRAGRCGKESNGLACSAGNPSWLLKGTRGTHTSTAETPAKLLTIVRVSALRSRSDVWCIWVPEAGHFTLGNGAVVHNCDMWRYVGQCVERMGAKRDRGPSTAQVAELVQQATAARNWK